MHHDDFIQLTAEIVAAYVEKNPVPVGELPALIERVHSSVSGLVKAPEPEPVELVPAVPIKKSVTPNYIISLESGKKFTSLKRHLMTSYGLTPEAYRKKWNLPADYPMVAPSYSTRRSELAFQSGLGKKAAPPAPAPKKRGRSAKA
ncbi:MucR family transcriptional regulator [Mesorhizobium sp. IMUNJ 23232]|uniref:MucR family transcriptional regulator n=1 Tax=Mesorhizobium sp. IMUNJ 23232 TaxID=3376064 RepID=UPI00378CC7D8